MVGLVFLIEGIVLFYFQSRYLFGGDSAEYSVVAETWSITHPPGYPFYSLLLNLQRVFMPFLSGVSRDNLLSLVPTILTTFILYNLFSHLAKSRFIALAVSSIYLFLFPIWLYASVPEAFAINNLILVLITYQIIRYNQEPNRLGRLVIFFLLGLSVTHHHTFVLFLPGWIALKKEKLLKFLKKDLFFMALSFLLGVSFYLYAPIASYFNPPLDIENAKTLEGLLRLITRSSYGTFKAYTQSVPNLANQLFDVFSLLVYLVHDFRIIGLGFILVGFWYMYKHNNQIFRFVILTLIFELLFLFYVNFFLSSLFGLALYERFLISIYLILIFPFFFGAFHAYTILYNFGRHFFRNFVFKKIFFSAIPIFFVLLVVIYFFTNLRVIWNLKNADSFNRLAQDILETPENSSIISTTSDNSTFTVSYYYYVKKVRPDLSFVSFGLLERPYYQLRLSRRYPQLTYPKTGDPDFPVKFISLNSKRGDVLYETPAFGGNWVPYGILWKYYGSKEEAEKDIEKNINRNLYLWNKVYAIPKLNRDSQNILQLKSLQLHYLEKLTTFTKFLINYNRYGEAKKLLSMIIQNYDENYTPAYRLLMILTAEEKDCENSSKYSKRFFEKMNSTDLIDIASMLQYYSQCEPNNNQVTPLLQQYKKVKLKQDIPLKTL